MSDSPFELGIELRGVTRKDNEAAPGVEGGDVLRLTFDGGAQVDAVVTKVFVEDGVRVITFHTPLLVGIEKV